MPAASPDGSKGAAVASYALAGGLSSREDPSL